MMFDSYQTILVTQHPKMVEVIFNRPQDNNSMTLRLLEEVGAVLSVIEKSSDIKIIVLKGNPENFLTGMDFNDLVSRTPSLDDSLHSTQIYFHLLKRLSIMGKVVVSCVEGLAQAGGLGFIAASDYVIARPEAAFSLSEALFGLIPANVLPFLLRRIGSHQAYLMTLLTKKIVAEEARRIGLVDEVSENIDDSLRRLLLKIERISTATLLTLKQYFSKMNLLVEKMESEAIHLTSSLMVDPKVIEGIKGFVQDGTLPYQINYD
jgi:polyketide biosynthesis enoyl-CoA hydratase PksH